MVDRLLDRGLRAATVVGMASAAAIGLALPESPVLGGAAWLTFLFCSLSGWGALVGRALQLEEQDFGLRVGWGAAAAIFVGGLLVSSGGASERVLLGVVLLGGAAAGWREATAAAPLWRQGQGALRGLRDGRISPALAVLAAALVAAALVRMLGGLASLERNVWDDDVGYLPLLSRLLQVGDLVEPFSFRRLGAYGGQLLLQGLAAARGTMLNLHLADKALCFGATLLLLAGMARKGGGAKALPLALIALLFLMLPDVGNNSASQWSGVMLLVAMYRSLVGFDAAATAEDERAALRWLVAAALCGAAACTLRQNYLAVVALCFAFALVARLRAAARSHGLIEGWRCERRFWVAALATALAVLAPWWIAAYASNQTFLFPLLGGTFNPGLSLRPTALSWSAELEFLISAAIEAEPLDIVAPLLLLLLLVRDRRAARPLSALCFATVGSFLLLVHSFVGSDLASLWRYSFASGMALTALFVLEVGDGDAARPLQLPALGRWALLALLLLQLLDSRGRVAKTYATMVGNLREAAALGRRGDPVARAERARYRAMQAAVPAGAPLAVMLDDAAYLDYARNPIANLDHPGYSSAGGYGRQWPAFAGPEALRRYFTAQGYRYLAFVRSDFSRYFYRRWYWLRVLYTDVELFQTMAAYLLDAIDNFAALAAQTAPLHDVDGLVVLDLGAPVERGGPAPSAAPLLPSQETARREAWKRQLAERLNLRAAWALNSRGGLVFDDGFSGVMFGASDELTPARPREPVELAATPVRWMHRRAHLRLRAERDMRLRLRGVVGREATGTRPRWTVSLDGQLLGSQVVADDGSFVIELSLAAAQLGEWADLYVGFSSVGLPERDSRELRFARLDGVEWEPQ